MMLTDRNPSSSLSAYVQSISSLGRITAREEIELSTAWRERGDTAARDRLITANLRLVIAYAKRYSGRGIPLDELVAEGNLGLIEAVNNFNPKVGCRFSTYAVFWIRKSAAQAFAHSASRPKATRHDRLRLAALEQARDEFASQNGRTPTSAELAADLGWSLEELRIVETLRKARSLQQSLSDLAPGILADDRQEAPLSALTDLEGAGRQSELLKSLFHSLSDAEQKTISLRFGLDSGSPRSIEAVAAVLGESPKATRARLRLAMAKLTKKGRARASADSLSGN
ncbi:MAG: sigma-70 family RNA polymerase sigma factor [Phycisphaerales bacterium]|nr:sigma-70 family RNA polymerase sigma factor [Planctomycetota bacterium]